MGKSKNYDVSKGFIMSAISKVNFSEVSPASQEQEEWRKRIEVWKDTYCKGASDTELAIFVETCKRTGLSPEKRQIYAVPRWDSRSKKEIVTPMTSIDGQRYIAQRSHNYGGQIGPEWCGDDGVWKDIWLAKQAPRAARCAVIRKDWIQPLWAVAKFDSYCQLTKDGRPASLWAKMPEVMIAKCAEALALRRAFPDELGGLYTDDEMAQAIIPVEAEDVAPKKKELAEAPRPEPEVIEAPPIPEEIYNGVGEQKQRLWVLMNDRDLIIETDPESTKAIAAKMIGVPMKDLVARLDEIKHEILEKG